MNECVSRLRQICLQSDELQECRLPVDVMTHTFQYLGYSDLVKLSQCNHDCLWAVSHNASARHQMYFFWGHCPSVFRDCLVSNLYQIMQLYDITQNPPHGFLNHAIVHRLFAVNQDLLDASTSDRQRIIAVMMHSQMKPWWSAMMKEKQIGISVLNELIPICLHSCNDVINWPLFYDIIEHLISFYCNALTTHSAAIKCFSMFLQGAPEMDHAKVVRLMPPIMFVNLAEEISFGDVESTKHIVNFLCALGKVIPVTQALYV